MSKVASSPLLLGFIDEPVQRKRTVGKDKVTWTTSKIGGNAVFPEGTQHVQPICSKCAHAAIFICQIYCPVDMENHRTLFVYCCANEECHKSAEGWTFLRYQKSIPQATDIAVAAIHQPDEWCCDEDDWGEPELLSEEVTKDKIQESHKEFVLSQSTSNVTEQFSMGESSAQLTCSSVQLNDAFLKLTVDKTICQQQTLLERYIFVMEGDGVQNGEQIDKHVSTLLQDYSHSNNDSASLQNISKTGSPNQCASFCEEAYEKQNLSQKEKLFKIFLKTVSCSPEQIVRYTYGGNALLMSSLEEQSVPKCEVCGSKRLFEMQLMPALARIFTAELGRVANFGTILMFTCVKNCLQESGYNAEAVIVQHDPDAYLFSD